MNEWMNECGVFKTGSNLFIYLSFIHSFQSVRMEKK